MFQENIINCPELFIEILRFIPDVQEDLLSLILINKQCHEIIEEKLSIFYQLLCKDRLDYEMFIKLKQEIEEENNETVINWKEKFLEIVLFSWSECLQTTPQPLTQIKEKNWEDISVKCIDNGCLLISSDKTDRFGQYRNIRSKYPILKDTTLHYYIKHLRKSITHHDGNFLLFGVMNEQICNTIVGEQENYTYVGEIVLEDKDLFSFNTSYASNGYISCYEKSNRKACEMKQEWKEEINVISVEVKGIKEGNIVIKYYLNDKLIYELKDILKDIDVIDCKENRLYFTVCFYQTVASCNNTLIIGSTQKLSENYLLNQFNKILKKYKEISEQ